MYTYIELVMQHSVAQVCMCVHIYVCVYIYISMEARQEQVRLYPNGGKAGTGSLIKGSLISIFIPWNRFRLYPSLFLGTGSAYIHLYSLVSMFTASRSSMHSDSDLSQSRSILSDSDSYLHAFRLRLSQSRSILSDSDSYLLNVYCI